MANVRIAVSKKGTLIAMIALVLLLGGGAGYLLWRVNQKDTVAPTDSSASGDWGCDPKFDVVYYLRDGTEKMCNACKSDQQRPVGQRCPYGPYLYECGEYCFPAGKDACGKDACDNISNPAPTVTLTYTADPGAGGSIIGKATQTFRKGGDGEQVEAKPNQGYNFDGWSDGTPSSKRRDTNVNASATYTANFTSTGTPDPVTYTLEIRVAPGGDGKVLDSSGNDVTGKKYEGLARGTTVSHKAVPGNGYRFTGWQDGKTDNPRNDTIMSNLVLIANFQESSAPPITNCTGFRVSCGENNTIKVNWNVLPSPATYVVRVNKEPKGDWYNDAGGDLYRSFPVNVNSYVVENVEPGKIYGISVIAHKGTDDNAPFYPSCNMTGLGDVWNPPLYVELACQGTTPVDTTEPIIVPGGTVPDTAIFDDTKDTIIFGIVILTIGITWTWVSRLPKKAYSSIKTISKASSEYVSNVKVKKEKNIRESRRNRLERKIR